MNTSMREEHLCGNPFAHFVMRHLPGEVQSRQTHRLDSLWQSQQSLRKRLRWLDFNFSLPGHSELTAYKAGWPAPVRSFISRFQMATLQTGTVADIDACSDDELVDFGNHKNEAIFTFSPIHQNLQYSTYPSDFQQSDKLALWKRSKFFKSTDGNLYYVGRDKLGIALCLLPHYLFSGLSYFILQQAGPKIGVLVQE